MKTKSIFLIIFISFFILGCSSKKEIEEKEIKQNKNKMYYYDCSSTKYIDGKQIFILTPVSINSSALNGTPLEQKIEQIKKENSFDKCFKRQKNDN